MKIEFKILGAPKYAMIMVANNGSCLAGNLVIFENKKY